MINMKTILLIMLASNMLVMFSYIWRIPTIKYFCGYLLNMSKYFVGKRILVTGGSDGIGLGIAIELWRSGADVVALSNQPDKLADLARQYPGIVTVETDLCDWYKSREDMEKLGAFHGLVNCAGIIINEPFLDVKPEHLDKTIAVNTKAILNASQVVAKGMIQNGIKGSIVNISSQSSMAALKDHMSYCASKGALDSMTRVMALELGPHGIRVNCVNPTAIMTELGRTAWADPEKASALISKIPLGRFGEVIEVVNTVAFLLSEQASMISGVSLPVDGGYLAT